MAFPETPLPIASELQLGESYLSCGAIATGINAPAGGTVYAPLDAAGHIGSDIDIRVDCAADDWTPTANLVLLAKNYSYGILDDEFSYEFELLTDGRLRLLWSEDGQFGTLTEAYSSVPVGVADRTRVTVRAVMDADIGGTTPQHTVTFYTGPTTNGPWTELGATQFGSGTTQIAETSAPIEIGSTNLAQPGFGLVGNFQGKIYKAEVWDAFYGERIVAPDFTRLARGTTEFTDPEGYRWYVYGSSYVRQEWIDATPDTREAENITVSRGLPSEGGGVDTAQCSFTLDNVNGYYSSRNPQGPYYGKLRRNTPHRVSVPAQETSLFLKRAVHDYAYTLDSAAISVTGNIDIRVDVDLNAWQGRYTLLLAKSIGGGSGEAGYYFAVNNEGFLRFTWSDDGTDSTETMTANVPVPQPFHGRKTVRVTLDVNNAGNHTAAFYYADSVTATEWTQIGTSVTVSGTTSIYDSDAELWFGGYFSGFDGSELSRFYAAQVRSGIGGTVVAYPDFRSLAEDTRQFSDAQGNLWKLAGSAEISARDDRHFGAVSEWPQRWDITGTDQYTPATSNGVLRRLGQGQSPLKSTMRRGIQSFGSDLIGYWPLEDEQGATSFASGIPDHPSMVFYGEPTLSTDSTFDASLPLPQLSESMFVGQIPDYRDTDQEVQAWFLLHIPEAVPDEYTIFRIFTRGSVFGWQLHVDETGGLRLFAYDPALNVVLNTGIVAFNVTGKHLRVSIGLRQNGTSIEYLLHTLEVGATTGSFISGNVTTSTLGNAVRVDSGHDNVLDQVTVGHISVHRVIHSLFELSGELKAYTGERAGARIYRLCHEEGTPVKVIGSHSDTVAMGPQPSATLLDLLTECADADLGFLHEPRDVLGIAYRTRASMHNQQALAGPKVEFDYSEEQLTGLDPTEDDRYTRNDITVTRDGGSSARTANDVSNLSVPALSVEEIGRYDDNVTVSLQDDTGLRDQAHWRVHMGTVDEARYPTVSVELGRPQILAVDDLAYQIKSLDVGDLLTITNLPARYPPEDVEQIALGFTETLSAFAHYIDINCAPASPYRVGVYDDRESRYDTQGSVLAHDLDETTAFMSVRTVRGPIWQTVGDFPFDINVGGERMRVVAVANNTSPQNFLMERSINGVVKSHDVDTPINLWRPVYYALGDSPLQGYEAPELPDSPPPEDPDVTATFRINVGGPAYTGPDGVAWDADRNFTGGTVTNQGAATYGTQHDGMLQDERWGSFTYQIPFVPAGAATVNLYFSENYAATPATAGYRAFDVTLNGVLVADNLDIYAQAGGIYKQLIKSYSTTIPASGICTIAFSQTGSPNNAAVCMGIEILAEGVGAPPDPPPPDPDDPIVTPYGWFSGVVRPSIAGQYTQANVDFWNTNFRGVEVSATLTYTVRTGGWGDLVNPGYVLGNWTNPNLTVIIAQPMVPNNVAAKGAQAQAINTGAYDGYWRTWGNSLNAYVARGMPEPITEIAWEFNGDWMYHSAFNASEFRTAFARIVNQIRTTRPTAKIAWTVNAGYSQNPPSHNAQDCYPGDAYVDYIGVDIYDHYPRAVGYAAINNRENTNTGRAKYWEAFADAHNKGMVFPEWGLQNATNKQAYGGGDNPDWMSWFWDWCQHLKSIGLMVAEVYFDEAVATNVRSTLLQPPLNANSRARYLSLW